MPPDKLALVISVLSLVLACLALGWNIYRDVILKPHVKVTLDVAHVVSELMKPVKVIMLSGTNFGPGKVRLSIVRTKSTSLVRRLRKTSVYGFVVHDYKNPMSGQLPMTLEPSERLDLVFPFEAEAFLKHGPTHVGIRDYYGRDHWAPRDSVKKAMREWEKAFANKVA